MSTKKFTSAESINPPISKLSLRHYPLQFKNPVGTSRGELQMRDTWFIIGETDSSSVSPQLLFAGEAGHLPGLTLDRCEDYPALINKLNNLLSKNPNNFSNWLCSQKVTDLLQGYPALYFALETIEIIATISNISLSSSIASIDNEPEPTQATLKNFFRGLIGIPMNGLIWMGSEDFQQNQMRTLLQNGFTTIKMKIGGLDFEKELALLEKLCTLMEDLPKETSPIPFTIRLDANGAFTPTDAPKKLEALFQVAEKFSSLAKPQPLIHSIEQPLPPLKHDASTNEVKTYRKIFRESPIPIALDEELIGKMSGGHEKGDVKEEILTTLCPHYLVLKPGVHGGFRECEEWIRLAKTHNLGWWVTSALESNLGLTAITGWTARQMAEHYHEEDSSIVTHHDFNTLPTQGLGTGGLYLNNFWSPLKIKRGKLFFDNSGVDKLLKDVILKTKV